MSTPLPAVVNSPSPLIVATEASEDFHTTSVVKGRSMLSVKNPVMTNCCVFPEIAEKFCGVMRIPISSGGVTVREAML